MSEVNFKRFLIGDATPFGNALEEILKGYFDAYSIFGPGLSNGGTAEPTDRSINEHFFRFVKQTSNHYDPHLAQGPYGSFRVVSDTPPSDPSRYSLNFQRLVRRSAQITSYANSRRNNPGKRGPAHWMYSPLYFARLLLTSPTFLASEALAHAVIRAYLFEETLKFEDTWSDAGQLVWTSTDEPSVVGDAGKKNAFLRIREIMRFDRVERSLQKLENFTNHRDTLPLKNATDFLVCHLLASQGMLLFRFQNENDQSKSDDSKPTVSVADFLASRSLAPSQGVYQFSKPSEVRQFPSASRVINDLDGLPIAIPGAELILQGGLRFTTEAGLVARLFGPAGIGKTSVALGLAAALAPLGTQTIYLSCEERPDDLLHRIRTLVPMFIKRTKSYQDAKHWFTSQYISGSFNEKREKINSFLEKTLSDYGEKLPNHENCPPGLMPLMIVLDGVHEMFPSGQGDDASRELRELVERCQKIGALVVAVSAENPRSDLAEFDYLVDFVAKLEFAASRGEMDPPTRLIRLSKTRRQMSRSGAHLLDLTAREQGIRIIPQINAHLSENRSWLWVPPSDQNVVDFLLKRAGYRTKHDGDFDEPLVKVNDRSQVLVMGQGSSGKSLFGLRLLSSPVIHKDKIYKKQNRSGHRQGQFSLNSDKAAENPGLVERDRIDADVPWFESPVKSTRRILVLSFLYQEKYYKALERKWKDWAQDSISGSKRPGFDTKVIYFSPGFLRPEDLIDRINESIEEALLEGFPFDGVLIDGIHNVYLQFPHLESSDIVWPALFELLRTRGLGVVTTHTDFDISETGTGLQDLHAARRRVAPLLHALVQSSDYVIKVHPIASLRFDTSDFAKTAAEEYFTREGAAPQNPVAKPPEPAKFLIEVPSSLSLGQTVPPVDWGWDRTRGIAFYVSTPGMGRKKRFN